MTTLSLPTGYSPRRKHSVNKLIQQATELLRDKRHLLVLLHNDPDPDAMASGRALEELLRQRCGPSLSITLAHGGMIGRAENRIVSELFAPHLERIPTNEADAALREFDAVVLVDTQPSSGNHLVFNSSYPQNQIIMAVDHHPPRRSQESAVVQDVRPQIGACATMLCEYLAVAQFPLDPYLATALFYGIKSDTRGLSRHTDPLDVWAYSVLRNLIDVELLSQIEQVRLPRSYFRSISDALNNTTLYYCEDHEQQVITEDASKHAAAHHLCSGDVAISLLYDMKRPDMAAEVADLLLRLEGVSWAICLGVFEDRLVISLRTDAQRARAGRLVRSIVGKSGTAGGHDTMAGGRIHLPENTPSERIAALHALVPRFLSVLGLGTAQGEPLLGSDL